MTRKIPVIMGGTVRRLFFAAAVLALASGGCATGHAKTVPVPTPLDVPAPPPRIIVPAIPKATDKVTEPPTKPATNPDPNKPKPASQPQAPPANAKPDPPVVTGPLAVTAPPAATLQQAPPTNLEEVKGQVDRDVRRAKADLNKVNRGALDADAKSQYDTASRFVAQAEQALKEGNLLVAAKVAEKAAALAAGLPVR